MSGTIIAMAAGSPMAVPKRPPATVRLKNNTPPPKEGKRDNRRQGVSPALRETPRGKPRPNGRPGGLWGLVTDGHDRRSPNAEGVIRVVETETHGKPLGEADPVELPVDLRQPHGACAAVGDHGPAQPHHGPVEVLVWL